jgi:DNA-binding transcriptional LysR family regulator
MPHMPDFEAWAIFAKVADRGSFSQAADELGLAKTTVSKAITRLEERLRTTLIHRTTRKLSLTDSGRLALERARRIASDGSDIEADILEEAAVPRGSIRLAVTTAFGLGAVAPILPDFLALYPEIDVDLCLTDGGVDIIADNFDCVLQIGPAADSSLRISRMLTFRRVLVASPAFIERYGMPDHPSDLEHMPAIIPTHVPWGEQWRFERAGEACSVPVNGRLRVNNASAIIPAVVAGLGMSALPIYFIWEEMRDGHLVEMLPDWVSPPGSVYVVTPPGRARPIRVRLLLDFLKQRFALLQPGNVIL